MGREGWAASVTAISPAGLWRQPLGPRERDPHRWARRLRPLVSLALRLRRPREAMLRTFAARPERIPVDQGRELVLGWIDAGGYAGANRAMRTHLFDPTGYPEDVPVTIAWGELDRLVGPPKPARRPAGARFLILPGRRPHADLGRPGAGRPHAARGQRSGRVQRTRLATGGGPLMIVERTENPQWLSNAYLVADEAGGTGVLIDGNDDLGPLLERAEKDGIEITHILVTHPHADHIAGLAEAGERLGGVPVVASAEAAAEIEGLEIAEKIADGETLSTGGLEIEAISTPGHAAGHLAFLVNGTDVFTADVLFKGTVGGTMAPGASGFDDLRSSVMRLLELPPGDRRPPRPPRALDDRRGARRQPVRAIWRGRGGDRRGAGHRLGPPGDAEAVGARLRRRQQGLGRLRRHRRGRDRRRLAGRALLTFSDSAVSRRMCEAWAPKFC